MANDSWRRRLAQAVEDSGRSKRSISLDSGAGSGYLHSILSEGKDPTIEKLMAVCETLNVSTAYILYGVDVLPEDAEIIRAMRSDEKTREAILTLLSARKGQ